MLRDFNIGSEEYQKRNPYPHMYMDNFLDENFAYEIQNEIMKLEDSEFDRYDNPFEQKYTLRNKYTYPPKLQLLMNELTSEIFLQKLSKLVGYELVNDPDRNFWGVHKYEQGDKLDIHVDAGKHPKCGLKKQVTLGIYLSYQWKPEFGGELEIWEGDNSKNNNAKLHQCVTKIPPLFNRLIIFTCDDYSWHGNPNPINDNIGRRIFVTLSYLSNNQTYENHRQKAFFIALPNELNNLEKDELRLLRADPDKYKEIYQYNKYNNQ